MLWAWDFWHSHPDVARGSKLQSDRKLRRNRLRHGEVAAKVDIKELDPPTVCFTWSTPGSSGSGISSKFHEKDNRYYFYTCLQNSTEWVFRWVRKKIMFSGFWSTFLAWVGLNTILTPVGRSLHILWKREVITLLPNQNFMWDCHTHVFLKRFLDTHISISPLLFWPYGLKRRITGRWAFWTLALCLQAPACTFDEGGFTGDVRKTIQHIEFMYTVYQNLNEYGYLMPKMGIDWLLIGVGPVWGLYLSFWRILRGVWYIATAPTRPTHLLGTEMEEIGCAWQASKNDT